MATSKTSYLSLGSNLENRAYFLQKAVFMIGRSVGAITQISSVYETPSWGFTSKDFLNVCIEITTTLAPQDLLTALLKIESQLGRQRSSPGEYKDRTIDIDILYYDALILQTDALQLPHPEMHERRFVLKPLADIAPQFYHPVLKKDTRNLLQECKDTSLLKKTSYVLYKDVAAMFTALNFVAIEGNIGAGKTTLAHKISEEYSAKLVLERFADNPFLPKFYKDQTRYAFPLEMSFLADRYQQYTDDTTQFDLFKKFMISDYDIYKSLIFAKITLQADEFLLYRKVFRFMYQEVKKPNLYVYLYQTTERLLDNIKKRGREYEQQIAPDYLDKINKGYFDFIKSYPEQNNLIIDVTDLDFVNSSNDYDTIIDQITAYAVQIQDTNIIG
ncbi:MAG: 2-amino-4-hydroxy-6-hydroxymethyldihydropteridine diphosphokinase [Eudoraea sp.]|nr:2-amino-4-hydroxy-6-hydroxymethyldihydropteridine diphosphokinase [Eudoraea sp.]